MRIISLLAVAIVALANAHSNQRIAAAPVPKETDPKFTIDGKYNLLAVSLPADRAGPGGFGGGGGAPGGPGGAGGGFVGGRVSLNSALLTGPATITKTEITLEGNGRISPLAVANGPTTMEYTLDTTKTPAFIDVEILNLRGKKSKCLGLVEVNGNRLIIALAKEGDERPKTTEEAENVTVYYFQKAPRTEYRIVAMTVGKEEAMEKELNKLALEGFELVSTTQPSAVDAKSSVTTVHFILKRTVK
jgi:uncharacterized protein (TIGR03067 family)